MGDNRLNIYLSEQDQRDLIIAAFIMAGDGVDGTMSHELIVNRSATIQYLIRCFKEEVQEPKDGFWEQAEQSLIMKGVLHGESGDDLSG